MSTPVGTTGPAGPWTPPASILRMAMAAARSPGSPAMSVTRLSYFTSKVQAEDAVGINECFKFGTR